MISIVTPTHVVSPYLNELWESIKGQTYKDWEWVLYLNGEIREKHLSEEIKNHKQVRIFQEKIEVDIRKPVSYYQIIIGKIKNTAFSLGKGSILLEADHDDILAPNCLEGVKKEWLI